MDALASSEFTSRKAAAEALSVFAQRLGFAMVPFREEVLSILEDLRFDKVCLMLTAQFTLCR